MFESLKSKELEALHNEGQEDGSSGRWGITTDAKEALYRLILGEEVAEKYHEGVENGRDNQSKED